MQFAILGPLQVIDDNRDLTPGRAKQRALLAMLLLHPNDVVGSDQLVEALWGERPPATALTALHGHVSSLRKLIGAERIETHPPGYRIRIDPSELDAAGFESILEQARHQVHPEERAMRLAEALALWRGDPLADLRYESFAQHEITRLAGLRIAALEDRLDADLALGRAQELVGELEVLVAEHPFRERLRSQLMLALYPERAPGRRAPRISGRPKTARRRARDRSGARPPAANAADPGAGSGAAAGHARPTGRFDPSPAGAARAIRGAKARHDPVRRGRRFSSQRTTRSGTATRADARVPRRDV